MNVPSAVSSPCHANDVEVCDCWFLAQLRPNQAERAKVNLSRQGYGVFMPNVLESRRHRGRIKETREPLFPGYLFVRILAWQEWRPIVSTYGVSQLVLQRPHRPQPVPVEVVAALQRRTQTDGVIVPETEVVPGDIARITAGPMSGFLAQVERLDRLGRVGVLLEVMGRSVRAEVTARSLQRVPA
ncbi:MAG: transcription termination/antitermination NusG family protein [Pseudomonadota bacterium]